MAKWRNSAVSILQFRHFAISQFPPGRRRRHLVLSFIAPSSVAVLLAALVSAQTSQPAPATNATPLRPPTRADILRGEYGPLRANNDLLFYNLLVRIDPEKKHLSGRNTIRFRMLRDDSRIQIDLYANLSIDKILLGATTLKYQRERNAVFIEFPETLRAGREYAIDFHYSGTPMETGRFGGFTFGKDPTGNPWITTACELQGASIWWPNKDQWRDEPEGMELAVEIPGKLVNVSNGRFAGSRDLGDGYTRWDWRVHYPINSYNVSLNIGRYVHFADRLGDLSMDFYVLPGNLEKAKRQFAQAKPMLAAYEKIFGEYPFAKDGYKLIEVPYSGMEHQSAVTYGNRFANGYLERDWTGVGVSLKFDFIIVHESAHEWFGNAVSAADVSDMWIQEGWATYLENLYVEHVFGYDDALRYVNGYKSKVQNQTPVITQRGIHRSPQSDQYFKGALFLHTLRSVTDNDELWWRTIRELYQTFKYRNIMTEDVVAFFNQRLERDLTPIFDQYLRRAVLPALELAFNEKENVVAYRWNADERAFAMPIRVGTPGRWQTIAPTTSWQVMANSIPKDDFAVATDLYYVNVVKQ
jgi:aminopeptidase N